MLLRPEQRVRQAEREGREGKKERKRTTRKRKAVLESEKKKHG